MSHAKPPQPHKRGRERARQSERARERERESWRDKPLLQPCCQQVMPAQISMQCKPLKATPGALQAHKALQEQAKRALQGQDPSKDQRSARQEHPKSIHSRPPRHWRYGCPPRATFALQLRTSMDSWTSSACYMCTTNVDVGASDVLRVLRLYWSRLGATGAPDRTSSVSLLRPEVQQRRQLRIL